MKRNLKVRLKKAKQTSRARKSPEKKFTSYDTTQPETDTYQEAREEGEASRQHARALKSRKKK